MEVITLNNEAFQNSCKTLFSTLDDDYDLVIGISKGGEYVLEAFALNTINKAIQFKIISIQRPSTTGFKKNKILRHLLKLLPYTILDLLRVYEAKKAQKNIATNISMPNVSIDLVDLNLKSIKKVLVLDDAVDSGVTLTKVVEAISKIIPEAIVVTAVLSWTNSRSLMIPNHYVYKDALVRFPWSLDYKSKSDG